MHGAVPTEKLEQLKELLQGLSGKPAAPFKIHETVLKGHKPPVELKLQRSMLPDASNPDSKSIRWKVRHESLPMRGQAANKLPAAARGVSETCCYGPKVIDFWVALGFKEEYQSVQEGVLYTVSQGEHQLSVRLVSFGKVPKGNAAAAVALSPDFWLVEVFLVVTTDTPAQMEGLYAAACRAISSFAGHLKEFVTLQKPKPR